MGMSMKKSYPDMFVVRVRPEDTVVALETAVLTHGLPEELGLEVMREMVSEVKKVGAKPAPVGMIEGQVIVGMRDDELAQLLESHNHKITSRDIPLFSAKTRTGGFTVSSTLSICGKLDIDVMATGGIGGVHRTSRQRWDVSSDLTELTRNGSMVVCSGPKSLLDVENTYEMLETLAVPMVVYGSDHLPAFHIRNTGIPTDHRVDDIWDILESRRLMRQLGTSSSMLILNSVPARISMTRDRMESLLSRIHSEDIPIGKKATPWVLEKIADYSDGESVEINRKLLVSNCSLAAEIAVEKSKTERSHG